MNAVVHSKHQLQADNRSTGSHETPSSKTMYYLHFQVILLNNKEYLALRDLFQNRLFYRTQFNKSL